MCRRAGWQTPSERRKYRQWRAPGSSSVRGFAGDRRGDFTRHLQLSVLAGDAIALRDEREVGVGDFGRTVGGLAHQHPHWPIEPGVRIRLDELNAERGIAEQHE